MVKIGHNIGFSKSCLSFTHSQILQKRFHDLIPGGCHTYAKGDDQFPEFMPAYIVKGKGCRVWDADNNEYIEYGMGLRSVGLGHSFDPIVKASYDQMLMGSNYTRPATIELDCAEEFLSMIDGAEMVKFSKDGSDAMDGAVKLARAYTGRDMIAICGDHPFFSVNDWFIGTTQISAGTSEVIRNLTVSFKYNDLASVEKLFEQHPERIACVILEAEKLEEPKDNFLTKLKDLCHKNGTVFILDEMITGFRWHNGGAQKKYKVIPDLSVFGKAMANGFSVSALAGKRELMELGGLHHNEERVFLMSTTHGAEAHALAAAIATMKFYKENPVIEELHEKGRMLRTGINKVSEDWNILENVKAIGPDCCLVYTTKDHDYQPSQSFRTLFLQETMKRGLLMPSAIVSYSHSENDINETIEKIHEVLSIYKKALLEGVDKYIEGKPVKSVYRKYN